MVRKIVYTFLLLVASTVTFGAGHYTVAITGNGTTAVVTEQTEGGTDLLGAIAIVNGNDNVATVVINADLGSEAEAANALSQIKAEKVDLSNVRGFNGTFRNDAVKYLILPNNMTKEQVNRIVPQAGKSICSGASANIIYTTETGWAYTDPKSGETVKVSKKDMNTKQVNGQTYGIYPYDFYAPLTPTGEGGTVRKDNGEKYSGTVYYSGGKAYGIDGEITDLYYGGGYVYWENNVQKVYDGGLICVENGQYWGVAGESFPLMREKRPKVYEAFGTQYLCDSNEPEYTWNYNKYVVIPQLRDKVVKLQLADYKQYRVNWTGGERISADFLNDKENIKGTYYVNGVLVYQYVMNGNWVNVYELDVLLCNGAEYMGDIYEHDGEKYGYAGSECPFSMTYTVNGSEVWHFRQDTKAVYWGKVFTKSGDSGYYGAENSACISLQKSEETAYTDAALTQPYSGIVFDGGKGVIGTAFELEENAYVYTYRTLLGETKTYTSKNSLETLKLQGDDLLLAVTETELSDAVGSIHLIAYVVKPGTLVNTLRCWTLLETENDKNNEYNYAIPAVTEATISGTLNAIDMCKVGNGSISAEGHYLPNGGGVSPTGALQAAPLRLLDISEAKFGTGAEYHPEDMTVSALIGYSLEELFLPVDASQTIIPERFIENHNNLIKSLCIPGNFKEIRGYAFSNNNQLTHFYTTEVDANGDGRGETVDFGDYTMTLPKGLEKIETGAFWNVNLITDVYMLSYNAPECQKDAFDPTTCVRDNSYDPTGTINKGNYVKKGEQTYGVLHWPLDIDDVNLRRYTDITRKYTRRDEYGNTDAYGNVLMWPTQSEFVKAYAQGGTGYLWDAWKTPDYSDSDWRLNNYTLSQWDADNLHAEYANGSTAVAFYNFKEYDRTVYDRDYRGWHQFVLAYPDENCGTAQTPDDVVFTDYEETDWYTICLPFDMNIDDVVKVFGIDATNTVATYKPFGSQTTITVEKGMKVYPNICTLTDVTRNVSNKNITLMFSPNRCTATEDVEVVDNQTMAKQWNVRKADDAKKYNVDDNGKRIIIRAGYPYLIKGYYPVAVTEEQKQALKGVDTSTPAEYAKAVFDHAPFSAEDRDFESVPGHVGEGAKLPYTGWTLNARDGKGNIFDMNDENAFQYTFIGSYTDIVIPRYTYFVSKSKSQGRNIWFYESWEPGVGGAPLVTWPRNHCVVAPFEGRSSEVYYDEATIKENDEDVHFAWNLRFNNVDDAIRQGVQAAVRPTVAFAFYNGYVSSIINVEDDGRLVSAPYGDIYNVSGQKVAEEGRYEGLAKGIYIVKGKKYVVK